MREATSAMGCESGADDRSAPSRCLRPAHQAQHERGVARGADRLDRVGVGSGAPLGNGGVERRQAGHVADRLGCRRDKTVGKDIEIARDAENSAEPAQFVRKPAVFALRQQRREGRQDRRAIGARRPASGARLPASRRAPPPRSARSVRRRSALFAAAPRRRSSPDRDRPRSRAPP